MLGQSSTILDNPLRTVIAHLQPARVLELGCGQGKFGRLARQAGYPPQDLRGVQRLFSAHEEAMLRSEAGYTAIVDRDILEYYREGFDDRYDLIVALDVIEHFLLSDAMSIIAFSLYRADWVLLVWPSAHPQDANTHGFDRHRCSFGLRELAAQFDVVHYQQTGFAQMHYQHGYHLALLRGYMNPRVLPPVGG